MEAFMSVKKNDQYEKLLKKLMIKKCAKCEQTFKVLPKSTQKYCGKKCENLSLDWREVRDVEKRQKQIANIRKSKKKQAS